MDSEDPVPLWEIATAFLSGVVGVRPALEVLAGLLAPAVLSLRVRGLIQVRLFTAWPARWEQGVSVATGQLALDLGRPGAWSPAAATAPPTATAATITEAGIDWL